MAKGLGISSILNRESLATARGTHTVSYVNLEKIQEHEKNRRYNAVRIEVLAREIEDQGLQSPVIVANAGKDAYLMVSGHRRLAAFRFLLWEGKEEYRVIPAIVREGLSNEQIEEMLYDGNLFTEMPSDAELAAQLAWKKERLLERKSAGERIPGKLLEMIAEELGINAEAARRMDRINRTAIPEVQAEFTQGNMSLREAYKVSRLSSEQQQELLKKKQLGEIKYLFPENSRGVHVPPEPGEDASDRGVHVPPNEQTVGGLSREDARFKAGVYVRSMLRKAADLTSWASREADLPKQALNRLHGIQTELTKFQMEAGLEKEGNN